MSTHVQSIRVRLKYSAILRSKPEGIGERQTQSLEGIWDLGYALDQHSQTAIGGNTGSHIHPDEPRTRLGEALYRYKYRGQRRFLAVIARTAADFLNSYPNRNHIDLIVPVPPSDTQRWFKPTYEIAELVGYLCDLPVTWRALKKVRRTPMIKDVYDHRKRMSLLDGAFRGAPSLVEGKNILLIDDLYRSGATLTRCCEALYQAGAKMIVVLTVTRTGSKP